MELRGIISYYQSHKDVYGLSILHTAQSFRLMEGVPVMNNMMSYGVLRREGGREGLLQISVATTCRPAVSSAVVWTPGTRYWAWLGLCRQELPVISSITFISSNWNDKYGDLKQPGPSKTASVNKSLSTWGDLMTFLQRRAKRGHLQLLLQQRIPQNCWPNYSKFPNEIQSKQIIEIWDGIIEVVHQELYGNLNIWGSVIWQTFWPGHFSSFFQIGFHTILCW